MKIRPVGPELFHADRETDGLTESQAGRQTDRNEEANKRFRNLRTHLALWRLTAVKIVKKKIQFLRHRGEACSHCKDQSLNDG
jgi:hypothetical protein